MYQAHRDRKLNGGVAPRGIGLLMAMDILFVILPCAILAMYFLSGGH
jgi:hypothetical protein